MRNIRCLQLAELMIKRAFPTAAKGLGAAMKGGVPSKAFQAMKPGGGFAGAPKPPAAPGGTPAWPSRSSVPKAKAPISIEQTIGEQQPKLRAPLPWRTRPMEAGRQAINSVIPRSLRFM